MSKKVVKKLELGAPSGRVLRIFLIGSLLVATKISSEAHFLVIFHFSAPISHFFTEFFGSIGEFLIIASTVAYAFSQVEQYEFMNKILDQRDLLVEVNAAGLEKIVSNSLTSTYEDEIENHDKLVICLRGSVNFFANRQRLILERLEAGKEIHVYCQKSGIEKIEKWKNDKADSGWKMEKMQIIQHDVTLMYNFLECDTGIWIKTYFSKYYHHQIAAPAFFVRKNSPLWESYRKDIKMVTGTAS